MRQSRVISFFIVFYKVVTQAEVTLLFVFQKTASSVFPTTLSSRRSTEIEVHCYLREQLDCSKYEATKQSNKNTEARTSVLIIGRHYAFGIACVRR